MASLSHTAQSATHHGIRLVMKHVKARATKEVIPFRSYHNVLSNFYMSDINVFGKTFRSAEDAYQWKKAMEVGKEMLAADTKNAVHAGEVKRLSKAIPADTATEWES